MKMSKEISVVVPCVIYTDVNDEKKNKNVSIHFAAN